MRPRGRRGKWRGATSPLQCSCCGCCRASPAAPGWSRLDGDPRRGVAPVGREGMRGGPPWQRVLPKGPLGFPQSSWQNRKADYWVQIAAGIRWGLVMGPPLAPRGALRGLTAGQGVAPSWGGTVGPQHVPCFMAVAVVPIEGGGGVGGPPVLRTWLRQTPPVCRPRRRARTPPPQWDPGVQMDLGGAEGVGGGGCAGCRWSGRDPRGANEPGRGGRAVQMGRGGPSGEAD